MCRATSRSCSDNSNSAYVGPVSGERWRIEYNPTFGKLNFQGVMGDYRRYFFMQPFTFAVRGLHYGRYGRDAEAYGNGQIYPFYLGEETLMRGYGYRVDRRDQGCAELRDPNACPVFDRMLGSRIDVINLEFRIPLFGSPAFGLLPTSFLPVEIAPFFDGGIAYSSVAAARLAVGHDRQPDPGRAAAPRPLRAGTSLYGINCVDHIPVFSAGVTARVNLLGYLILETYRGASVPAAGEELGGGRAVGAGVVERREVG